jgi:hypothetical protein
VDEMDAFIVCVRLAVALTVGRRLPDALRVIVRVADSVTDAVPLAVEDSVPEADGDALKDAVPVAEADMLAPDVCEPLAVLPKLAVRLLVRVGELAREGVRVSLGADDPTPLDAGLEVVDTLSVPLSDGDLLVVVVPVDVPEADTPLLEVAEGEETPGVHE